MLIFAVIITSLVGCVMEIPDDNESKFVRPGVKIDLPEIIKKGKITILAENSSTTYFYYKGKEMGFEYELLKIFADEIGVELEVKVVKNLDSLISMLNRGDGDLIACNYTITRERSKDINFSKSFIQTPQVLIQRKPEGWRDMKESEWKTQLINNPSELARKHIQVWKNSSYYQRLSHLQEEIGDTIFIDGVDGKIGGEELIEMVSEGLIDYTITERNVAKVNQQFFDNLYTEVEMSVKQKMAFGIRKSSPLLKLRLDQWLEKFKSKSTFKYISKKYFNMKHVRKNNGTNYAFLNKNSISKFDAFFKSAGEYSGWDWRLIAAVSYQESHFNPNALSFGGAYGMMQFMPSTGPTYGVFPDSPPEIQILGGSKKLMADEKYWMKVPNELQRKKFALASYNAGRGHILDAQRLAEKHGLNPLIWDDNVEKMLLNLAKKEYYQDDVVRHGMMKTKITYNYVNEVMERYFQWVTIYN
ncbi:MAG: transporter substrate-binding domain-containing protein [Flavobacteriales bacterium]|nr:transporter substrate-binding domain-containing protein [Flavobacteriales bacterium]